MKNLLLLALLTMFICSCGSNEPTENGTDKNSTEETTAETNSSGKKYGVESGYIKYKISMMGDETVVTQYFKEFGEVEYSITETFESGKAVNLYTLNKGGKTYIYNLDEKKGILSNNADEMIESESKLTSFNKQEIEEQGGVVVGEETILGKKCAVYEISSDFSTSKIWVWNSLVLKMVATFGEMKTNVEATEIKETSDFPEGIFEVPKGIKFVEPNLEDDFDEEGAKG